MSFVTRRVGGVYSILAGMNRSRLALVFGLLLILSLFIIPLPPPVLDLLLVTNIVLALILLLRALFLPGTEEISAFPKILLLATLFRLALNVSSTRLILTDGDQGLDAAGRVIESFGHFVVQGDFVVGAIIFSIIAIVNFMVIARGSARVAEVSARFTLDALPGKQLAIDADLRSGTITPEDAQIRRTKLAEESQFYGSMDGAMKFVQGDAIATLIIAAINAIGGVSIGVSRGLEFSDAVATFGLLTIGDGLVTILPALLISVCAGIVVTHVASPRDASQGSDIVSQVFADPQSVVLGALSLLVLGLIPGFPFFPFFVVGVLLLGFALRRNSSGEGVFLGASTPELVGGNSQLALPGRHALEALPWGQVRDVVIECGTQVIRDPEERLACEQESRLMQQQISSEKGLWLPEVTISQNPALAPDQFRILLREGVVLQGKLPLNYFYALASAESLQGLGIEVAATEAHPITDAAGCWFSGDELKRRQIQKQGMTVISAREFVLVSGFGVALSHIEELFGVSEAQSLVASIKKSHPVLTAEVFEKGVMSIAEFAEILRRLLRERSSIRDMKLILEGVMEFYSQGKEFDSRVEWLKELHAFLRVVLGRMIVADSIMRNVAASGEASRAQVVLLSPELEEEFRAANSLWDGGRSRVPLSPELTAQLEVASTELLDPIRHSGRLPVVVLCSQDIRLAVQEFFFVHLNASRWIRLLAFEEMEPHSRAEAVGVLSVR